MKKLFCLFIGLVAFVLGCRDPYYPELNSLPDSYLVVEGVLNAGAGNTTIRLTRTSKLDQQTNVVPEDFATVSIEGLDNSSVQLPGLGDGNYGGLPVTVDPASEYRVVIRTPAGKTYNSDFVKVKLTPPIDTIAWDRNEKGIQLYVNAEDPTNNSRYYRWEYEEAWEIRSEYASYLIYENGIIRRRIYPDEDVSVCWKYNNSSKIILGNSTRLANDVMYKAPITLISPTDDRISVRYSILVRQYTLEKNAYDFFEQMRRNTEELGSIFSPQPSETSGNIHNESDPSEPVIGFFSCSRVVERRLFITTAEVFPWQYIQYCPSRQIPNDADSIRIAFGGGALIPYYFNSPPGDFYLGSSPECVDCRIRGGIRTRPSFW